MLSSFINIDKDVEIFLTDEEVKKLKLGPLKGEIFEFEDVRNLYSLEVLVDAERNQKKSHSKIGTEMFNNKYFVYVSQYYYEILRKEEWIGTRDGPIKIDLIKESFANENEEFAGDLRRIKSRYENRDKIIKYMERT